MWTGWVDEKMIATCQTLVSSKSEGDICMAVPALSLEGTRPLSPPVNTLIEITIPVV